MHLDFVRLSNPDVTSLCGAEFGMRHRVTKGVLKTIVKRVDGKISGVIGQPDHLTWPHIRLYYAPTIDEQLGDDYMGGGWDKARMAWALKDSSDFLLQVKFSTKTDDRGLEDGTARDLKFYFSKLNPVIIQDLQRNGVDGSYWLVPGEEVEFGYHDNYAD